jgi:hypothetical protein
MWEALKTKIEFRLKLDIVNVHMYLTVIVRSSVRDLKHTMK